MRAPLVLVLLFSCSACGEAPVSATDSGTTDSGTTDAAIDAAPRDAASLVDAATGPCLGAACEPCDDGLGIDDGDPLHAARALGVCSGLVEAEWTLPDGAAAPGAASFALGHGVLAAFGDVVRPTEGARMLALSTGTARAPSDPGFSSPAGFDKQYAHGLRPGFPVEFPACPGLMTGTASDGIALRLTLDVPSGANGFRLALKHHSSEWPGFVCTSYDDEFALVVTPPPPGAAGGNVVVDEDGNPLSVNTSFIDVCSCGGGPPCPVGGITYACSAGTAELAGTGFAGAGAATQWLEVRVPATAGARIEVVLMMWDSGDPLLDSTTLVDGFQWIADAPAAPQTRVVP